MSKRAIDSQNIGSSFKRYKSVTISIAVFLLFASGVMYAATHISGQIQESQVQIDAAGVLSDSSYDVLVAVQSVHQEMLEQELSKGRRHEGGDDAVAEQQAALTEAVQSFDEMFTKLEQGGDYDIIRGVDRVEALSSPETIAVLQKIKTIWQQRKPDIQTLAEYKPTNINHDLIHDMTTFTPEEQGVIYEEIDKIIVALNADIAKKTDTLHWVQRSGIAASLIYFLFFIGFFMRRLSKSDEKAEIARRETDEIMQTVNNGLFLLDKDLNIGSQYSAELERLWGKKELGGKNMLDVLSDMVDSQENLETAGSFVNQLYNPRTKERLIRSLNPLIRTPMTVTNDAGVKETRYLDFKFNRVYQGQEISHVLVSVSDVSDAVRLEEKIQREREQSDLQLEMLGSILKTDPNMMADFIANTEKRNQSINEKLKEPVRVQSDFFNKLLFIFREVHGLKGDASSLGLQGFVVIAENLEHTLKDLQSRNKLTGEDFLPLTVSLEELFSLTQTIGDLSQRIIGNNVPISPSVATNSEPVKTQLNKFVAEVAERNGKLVDFTCIGMDNISFNINTRTNLRELAIQLLRNSIVHGIEEPDERVGKHKLPAGHLRVEMRENDDSVLLSVQDDGTGIDLEKIRQKLAKEGFHSLETIRNMDAKSLIKQIFVPGFSTRDHSDEDAGRGVGMDIVHDRVKQMNGKISIATRAGAYTRVTIMVPKNH